MRRRIKGRLKMWGGSVVQQNQLAVAMGRIVNLATGSTSDDCSARRKERTATQEIDLFVCQSVSQSSNR